MVDANHLLHRVLHVPALAGLSVKHTRHAGRDEARDQQIPFELGGAFGFLRVLKAAMLRMDAKRCIAVWDGSKYSERRLELFPGYKDRGPRTDNEQEHHERFVHNRPVIRRLLPLLGVRTLRFDKREGDDVIYEVVQRAAGHGYVDRVIMSEDKDFLQMVGGGVRAHMPIRNVWVDEKNFCDEMGLPQQRWMVYRAIDGDKSDKIPGPAGVGPKTALQVITEAPSVKWRELEEFCAAHKSARVRKVAAQIDVVKRNYKLMRLGREVFDDEEIQKIDRVISRPVRSDLNAARAALNDLNFKSITSYYTEWVIPFIRAGARWGAR